MKPTRAQLNLAARIYTLSLAAQLGSDSDHRTDIDYQGTPDSDEQERIGNMVRVAAARRASKLLDTLGTGAVATDVAALSEAMRLKP